MTFNEMTSENLAKLLSDNISAEYPGDLPVPLPLDFQDKLKTWILDYLGEGPINVSLSNIEPDFEQLVNQLQQRLYLRQTWRDILTAGTGQTIIEFMAAIGVYNQVSIQRALQEAFIDTARLESGVLSNARNLSMHVIRKRAAETVVIIERNNPEVFIQIPAYTSWSIGPKIFFNRDPIIFNVGISSMSNIKLFQGQIVQETFQSSGTGNQTFDLEIGDFQISDDDILCTVFGEGEYIRTQEGLWNYTASEGSTVIPKVFYENTLPDGKVEVKFGNDIYGKIPTSNADIIFTYAITDGEESNSSLIGLPVSCQAFSSISGQTVAPIINGSNEKDLDFYRGYAPLIFAANKRMVTREDYKALALTYPGVVDVIFRGQRELGPQEKEYMNIIGVTLLTSNVWDNSAWFDFVEWCNKRDVYVNEMLRINPEEIIVNISARIYCNRDAALVNIENSIKNRLNQFFKKKRGWLGYSVYINDIHREIYESNPGINYLILDNPTVNYEILQTQYLSLGTISLNLEYTNREDRGFEFV